MKRSQCAILIDYMATGRVVSTIVAMKRWGVTRLSERIRELERRGHKFIRRWVRIGGHAWMTYRLIR